MLRSEPSVTIAPMHTRKLLTTLTAAVLAGATLAGCGGSSTNGVESKSPTEIISAAQKAAESAKSVRVTGSVSSAGTALTLNLQIGQGQGAKGTISEGPLSFELIRVGSSVYIKGSAAFYEHFAGSEAAKLLQGKWLQAPATSGEFAQLGSLTNMSQLLSTVLGRHGSLSKTGTSTVEGKKVVGVKDASTGGVLYVATTGKPYPVQISKTGSTGGKVTFEDWDASLTITAPPGAINIEKLKSVG
jgi:hypothetical protein